MAPGDTFLTNDPFEGGTHACDFAIVRPIFVNGTIIAYGIAIAHLLDVGGAVAGSLPPNATSVFQEGLRLSGVRLTREDRLVGDIIRIITENVRLPYLVLATSMPNSRRYALPSNEFRKRPQSMALGRLRRHLPGSLR